MNTIKLASLALILAGCSSAGPGTSTGTPLECHDPIVCPMPQTCPTCQTCTTCPAPVACPPKLTYVDPCAGDAPDAATIYDDGHGLKFDRGGSIRLNGLAEHTFKFEPDQTIEEVRVRIVPKLHSSLAHVHLPSLSIWREVEDGSEEFVARAVDPYDARSTDLTDPSVAAEYSAPHDLVLSMSEVTKVRTSYLVRIVGEWEESPDRGQAQDITVCGTLADLAP